MTEPRLTTVIGRNPEVVQTRVGDQTMMMSIAQGRYYALEATGQRIWEIIETPHPISAIVEQLVAEYDVERDRCVHEVAGFAGRLVDDGLAVEIGDA